MSEEATALLREIRDQQRQALDLRWHAVPLAPVLLLSMMQPHLARVLP